MRCDLLHSEMLEATPCAPAFIGKLNPFAHGNGYSYFFNGQRYYAFQHDRQLFFWLPELDSTTLRVKKPLLGDAERTIVGAHHFEVTLRRSRRIGKHGHYYFIIGDKIYQAKNKNGKDEVAERQDIDIDTFSVIDEDYAQDDFHYFLKNGKKVALSDLKDEQHDFLFRFLGKTITYQSPLPPLPRLQDDALTNLNALSDWLADESRSNWFAYASDGRFYPYLLAYFKLAVEVYAVTNNSKIYESAVIIADRYSVFFVVEPRILAQLEKLHNAAQQPQRAEKTRALSCILDPEDLAFTPAIAVLLRQAMDSALVAAAQEEAKYYIYRRVLARYKLLDRDELEKRWAAEESWFVAVEIEYFNRYVLLDRVVDVTSSSDVWRMYQAYKDYDLLNPLAHLKVANGLFIMAHQWFGWTSSFFDKNQSERLTQAFYIAHHFFRAGERHVHSDSVLEEAEEVDLVRACGGLMATQQYCEQLAQKIERERGMPTMPDES